jgi:hypothetical protein
MQSEAHIWCGPLPVYHLRLDLVHKASYVLQWGVKEEGHSASIELLGGERRRSASLLLFDSFLHSCADAAP